MSTLKSVSEEDASGREDDVFEQNSHGVTESNGVTHSDHGSSGLTHGDHGSSGVTHGDHGSSGVTHGDHGSSGVTHGDHGSSGVTHSDHECPHSDRESNGVPHSDHGTHDAEGLQEHKRGSLEPEEEGIHQTITILAVGGKESADKDDTVTDSSGQLVGDNRVIRHLEPEDDVTTEGTGKDQETGPDQRSPDMDDTQPRMSTQPQPSPVIHVESTHGAEYNQLKPSGMQTPRPDHVHARVSEKSSADSGFVSAGTTLRSDPDSMTSDHSQSTDLKPHQQSGHVGRQSEDTTAGGCGIAARSVSTPGYSELDDFGDDFDKDVGDAGGRLSRPGFHRSHSIDSKLRVAADVSPLGFSRNLHLRSSGPQFRTGSEDSLTR